MTFVLTVIDDDELTTDYNKGSRDLTKSILYTNNGDQPIRHKQ
jgi:hypothetical protein